MAGILASFAVAGLLVLVFLAQKPAVEELGELHSSVFSKPDIFDEAYSQVEAPAAGVLRGILVNHHLLAADLIAEAFEVARDSNPTTVILLSPNHFDSGRGQITTTKQSWQTPYGKLAANSDLATELAAKGVATIDPVPFGKEHGVSGIVPFVKKSFPKARLLPIIFKSTVTPGAVNNLVQELQNRGENILVVASIDMSHYVGEEIAIPQDKETEAALVAGDPEMVWNLKMDSPASMYALLNLTQSSSFHLLRRSSSVAIVPGTKPEYNTSYITGYFK